MNMHCSALRLKRQVLPWFVAGRPKPDNVLSTNHLSSCVTLITTNPCFGSANASSIRTKRPLLSYDLHSLRRRASLHKPPFWLAERHPETPFLIAHHS